jgi:oxaloacetate decarboxylase beta subunit
MTILSSITPGMLVMFMVAAVLIYLAIAKEYEPTQLLPIGFGTLLGNLPNSPLNDAGGMLYILNEVGIRTELFPLFIFIGIGALMDFRPLLSQPMFALMGAAGQFGIFATLILATALGFPLNQASSIAIIGAIDGPTSIYVASQLAPELLAPIAVTAYSYMSLVPVIQPPIMRLLTHRRNGGYAWSTHRGPFHASH